MNVFWIGLLISLVFIAAVLQAGCCSTEGFQRTCYGSTHQ